MDAGLMVRSETSFGEIGAADDRLGLGAGLKVEDLRMEAAWPVLGDEGARNIDKAVDQIGIGGREVGAKKDGLELGLGGEQALGDIGQVAPRDGNGDPFMLFDERGQTARDLLCVQ
ncbi:hypothetical protein [Sphingomonas sp. 3P27F8]|uniref:hypothetical protein n=1 Tax=Sphingomonas sp. 3P27F8 TaxID=2502213 RepID=UPI0020164A13|nr:hypothetical protein [Sphingomonas sp. 3P27F8]